MTPCTWSRCETWKSGGEMGPTWQLSLPLLPTSTRPKRPQMNFDESIPCWRALITVCAVKGCHHYRKERALRPGHRAVCILLKAPRQALNLNCLCSVSHCVHRGRLNQQGVKSTLLGGRGDTLERLSKVLPSIRFYV